MASAEEKLHLHNQAYFTNRAIWMWTPLNIIIVPLSEGVATNWWGFWRWSLLSAIGQIVMLVIFFAVEHFFLAEHRSRFKNNYRIYLFGFILGASHGLIVGLLAKELDMSKTGQFSEVLLRALNSGLIGLIVLPIIVLIIRAIALYRDDRNALVAERMLIESQKADTIAVLKSLRSSMSRKVDENLLEVIQNSKEYFDEKGKSLEDNWELMAIRLRQAAMKTIRPFSHRLHRRGSEKIYKVRLREIAEYTAYSLNLHIPWVSFIFAISTYRTSIQDNYNFINGLTILALKLLVLAFGLYVIQFIRSRNRLRTLYGYFLSGALFAIYFIFLSLKIHDLLDTRGETLTTYFVSTAWILLLVFIFSFIGAFTKGQRAELDFLERAISKVQLEHMILAREEARISRELAKYLHGTIQSRLMASAIGLEKAGRRGDKKALEKELAQAYESLKIPSASYFSAPEITFKEEIKKVVGKWNDLMKITVKFPRSIPEIQPDIAQEIGNVLNEGLSNSFRHGNATVVKIEFKSVESQLHIVLIDDGSGPTSGKPGLGTEWFRAISGNSWNLRRVDIGSGSILELFVLLK